MPKPKRRSVNTSRKPAQANHRRFADEYLANGFNATRAYKHAYPHVSHESAMRNGSRLLRDAEVATYLKARMDKAFSAQQMGGDEALARLARVARLDVNEFIGDDGTPIPPQQWPELGSCVRAFQYGPDGVKLTFVDPGMALRTFLEITGKLASAAGGLDALAAALREDLERRK